MTEPDRTQRLPLLFALAAATSVAAGTSACSPAPADPPPGEAPSGMVWIPGATFQMGSEGPLALPDEGPVHEVTLRGFWLDTHEVTNAEFARFIEATEYTTTAERAPTPEELAANLPPGVPVPDAADLSACSLVFQAPNPNQRVRGFLDWWRVSLGADWRHPEGPDSDLDGRAHHPVVHITHLDANAYCAWANKRLPTEAEWERAARGTLPQATYTWGNDKLIQDQHQANTHQGNFPYQDDATDGHQGTAPVGSYPPNAHGLYDMSGNVWEWTADWYRPDTYAQRANETTACTNPTGPATSHDPTEPYAPKRVTRGGSFLCNDSYCIGYRPSSRMRTTADTSLGHTGFRCAR
jgi:formylglycine-generating enzyme required for sulfatase activity